MIKFFIRGDWKVEIIYIEDSLETSITCLLNQDLRTYLVPPNRINSKQINKIFFIFTWNTMEWQNTRSERVKFNMIQKDIWHFCQWEF